MRHVKSVLPGAPPAAKSVDRYDGRMEHAEPVEARAAPEPDAELRNQLFEFHKKLAMPAACLIFSLFAVPAAFLAPRSGRAYGLLVGMVVAAGYWSLLVSAHGGGLRHQFAPALAIWAPNLAVLALSGALYLTWRWRCGYSA